MAPSKLPAIADAEANKLLAVIAAGTGLTIEYRIRCLEYILLEQALTASTRIRADIEMARILETHTESHEIAADHLVKASLLAKKTNDVLMFHAWELQVQINMQSSAASKKLIDHALLEAEQ